MPPSFFRLLKATLKIIVASKCLLNYHLGSEPKLGPCDPHSVSMKGHVVRSLHRGMALEAPLQSSYAKGIRGRNGWKRQRGTSVGECGGTLSVLRRWEEGRNDGEGVVER